MRDELLHDELVAESLHELRRFGSIPEVARAAVPLVVDVVLPLILERVEQAIKATAEDAATTSRDYGRGYMAAAGVVRAMRCASPRG